MGDEIHLIDTTVWTRSETTSGTGGELITNGDFSSTVDPLPGFYKMGRSSPWIVADYTNTNDSLGINLALLKDETNHFVCDVVFTNGVEYTFSFDIVQITAGQDITVWTSNGTNPHTIIQSYNTVGTHTFTFTGSTGYTISFYTSASDFFGHTAYIDNISAIEVLEITTDWTWLGDYSQLKYEWHIADITDPCTDYKNYGVESMKFPIRVIQSCDLDNFNFIIEYFYYPATITDIIVRINENVYWYAGDTLVISDFDNINSYYATDWLIISKGTDVDATNNENDSNHFRLRKTSFNNTTDQFPSGNYRIYRYF